VRRPGTFFMCRASTTPGRIPRASRISAIGIQDTPVDSMATVVIATSRQPIGQFMQVRGEGVEDAHRMRVPVRRHGHVHLAGSNIDACRIRLQQRPVLDIGLLRHPPFAVSRLPLFLPASAFWSRP